MFNLNSIASSNMSSLPESLLCIMHSLEVDTMSSSGGHGDRDDFCFAGGEVEGRAFFGFAALSMS